MSRHPALSSPGRHRARRGPVGTAVRVLAHSPVLAAGVLVTVAVTAAAFDTTWQPVVGASALEFRLAALSAPAAPPAPAMVSSGVGAAAGLQDPLPLDSGAPAAGVRPTRLVIPAIDVDVDLVSLQRDTAGVLLPPADLDSAGWYTASAVPGAVGPAVLAGHVDDTETAGVFSRLHELQPGDAIAVALSDGSSREYRADRAIDVAKEDFPTEQVYGPTPNSQLRLITCNGPYDYGVMHYSNNLVVFAEPVD